MFVAIFTLILMSSVLNALMDLSSEGNLGSSNYWNKNLSWRYKWKNGNPSEGERFPLSSTVLVFLTDGWHLLQFLFHTCWQLAISLSFDRWFIAFIVIKTVFSIVFELTYRKIKNGKD